MTPWHLAVEAAEIIVLVYLMWVVGELAAALREHLAGHVQQQVRKLPVPGCFACRRSTGVCWEHAHCDDCRTAGPDARCAKHKGG